MWREGLGCMMRRNGVEEKFVRCVKGCIVEWTRGL